MLAALVLASASAHAEPPAGVDREGLAKLLRQGAEAARAKRWSACVDAYAGALSLEETATTQGELGICEDALGRNVSAFLHLSAAMRAPGADRTKEPWKRFAVSLARVAPRVAQVFLTADPPHAALIIDGRPAGRTEGRSFVLEPGPHQIAARLDGYTDAIQSLDLKPGDLPNIYLQLRPKPKAAPPAPPLPRPALAPKTAQAPPAWYLPAWSPRGAFVTATYLGAVTTLASAATAIGLEVDRGALRSNLGAGHACGPAEPSPRPSAPRFATVRRNFKRRSV